MKIISAQRLLKQCREDIIRLAEWIVSELAAGATTKATQADVSRLAEAANHMRLALARINGADLVSIERSLAQARQ